MFYRFLNRADQRAQRFRHFVKACAKLAEFVFGADFDRLCQIAVADALCRRHKLFQRNGAESQNEKVETSSQQLNQMNGKLFEVTEVSEAVTESSIK